MYFLTKQQVISFHPDLNLHSIGLEDDKDDTIQDSNPEQDERKNIE